MSTLRFLTLATTCLAAGIGAIAASPVAASSIMLTPVSFDFGNVFAGEQSAAQKITLTNTSNTPQTPQLAGGGVGGSFGGFQDCGGKTLAPGESCTFTYHFTPSSTGADTGTTSITVDGKSYQIQFRGHGVDPILVTARSFDYGAVPLGQTSAPQSVRLTNLSNVDQTPTLAGGGIGRAFGGFQDCGGVTLAPGTSCSFTYAFTPDTPGPITDSTSITVNGASVPVSVTGFGGDPADSPYRVTARNFSFGSVARNDSSAPQVIEITNVSDLVLTPSMAGGGIGGNFRGFQNCGGVTLNPGESCQFTYLFTPTVEGLLTGSTAISIDGVSYPFTFEGTGLDPFLVTPLGFDFGEIPIGATSPTQSVVIKNTSGVNQTPSMAGGGVGGPFSGFQNCGGVTLAPGAECAFTYRFTPTALGPFSGQTSITIDGKSRQISFAGEGIAAAPPPPPPSAVPLPTPLGLLSAAVLLLPFGAGWRRETRRAQGRG